MPVGEGVLGDHDVVAGRLCDVVCHRRTGHLHDGGHPTVVEQLSGGCRGVEQAGWCRPHLSAGIGGGVRHDDRPSADRPRAVVERVAAEMCGGAGDEVFTGRSDPSVLALGVLVDPRDRRAGDDVVELLEQQVLPERVDLGHHVGGNDAVRRCRPQQLDLAQQPLTPAVADLRGALTRERPSVHLEVQLTRPHRHRGTSRDLLIESGEEVVGGPHREPRCSVEVGESAPALDHLAGRSATTVPVAVRHQAPIAPAVLLEVALAEHHLLTHHGRVVGVDRREVGEHA